MCNKGTVPSVVWVAIAVAVLTALTFGEGAAGDGAAQRPPAFSVTVVGEGPPMILIPGLVSSGEVWDSAIARYRQTRRLHVLTLAGFAGRPPIEPPFLATVRDEIVRYIRDQGLDRPVLVGHSLGGFLAFWVAATAPEAAGAVIAVDGVPFLPALLDPAATAETAATGAEQLRRLYATMTPEQHALQSRIALAAMITDPENVELAVGWALTSDPAAAGAAIAELMTTDLRPLLPAITAPVLLVAAAQSAGDDAARERLRERYEGQVAGVPAHRVVLAPKARHFVMLDDPGFLYAEIDRFLAVPASPAGTEER